jgi:hypothetical protein
MPAEKQATKRRIERFSLASGIDSIIETYLMPVGAENCTE